MSQLFVLFEHAAGYALFRTTEVEELTMLLPQVEENVRDLQKFRSMAHLMAFYPFKTAKDALQNLNSLSEGILHSDLQLFLETNVPKSKKKRQPVVLGVSDSKLGAAIMEATSITCQASGVVPEIIRGIRSHFPHLVDGLTGDAASKAQLGLGHNYSRAKVKFNVNRVDNMVIQSVGLVDLLDKDINTFAMRLREWYSYHFPELIKIVPENALYAKVIKIIKDRKAMPEDVKEKLEEVLMDSTKAQNVLSVARTSMGMDISPLDMINIQMFATRVIALTGYRKQLMEYLKNKMHDIAPNLSTLIGDTVGARLISRAGSLTNLAKYPASTVQILGAEKALFRSIKTRGNTPKYGLIFHSTFIGRAAKQNKGRISRYLANKCSIASRIDCFSEIPTDIFGQKLKQQVEDRLKFYENGNIPAKNIDVMSAATDEAVIVQAALAKKRKKKAKKDKKKREQEEEALTNSGFDSMTENSISNSSEIENGEVCDESEKQPRKKKKRNSEVEEANSFASEGHEGEENSTTPRKKKKKKNNISQEEINSSTVKNDAEALVTKSPKKRKNVSVVEDANSFVSENEIEEAVISNSSKKKKKKVAKSTFDSSNADTTAEYSEPSFLDTSGKKKKKKKKSDE